MRFYEMTINQKIFKKTHWGQHFFKTDDFDEEIFRRRDKLVFDYKILKVCPLREYYFIYRYSKLRPYYNEMYEADGNNVVIVCNPFIDDENELKKFKEDGWEEIDDVFGPIFNDAVYIATNNTKSYVKVINKNQIKWENRPASLRFF